MLRLAICQPALIMSRVPARPCPTARHPGAACSDIGSDECSELCAVLEPLAGEAVDAWLSAIRSEAGSTGSLSGIPLHVVGGGGWACSWGTLCGCCPSKHAHMAARACRCPGFRVQCQAHEVPDMAAPRTAASSPPHTR